MEAHETDEARRLLMEVAGFLTLIVRGIPVPNQQEQADYLLNKIGDILVKNEPSVPQRDSR